MVELHINSANGTTIIPFVVLFDQYTQFICAMCMDNSFRINKIKRMVHSKMFILHFNQIAFI